MGLLATAFAGRHGKRIRKKRTSPKPKPRGKVFSSGNCVVCKDGCFIPGNSKAMFCTSCSAKIRPGERIWLVAPYDADYYSTDPDFMYHYIKSKIENGGFVYMVND